MRGPLPVLALFGADDEIERRRVAVQHRRYDGVDAPVHDLIVFKTHVGFVRVHVYIDSFVRNIYKNHIKGILPFHEIACICICDRRRDRIVNDETTVDKAVLVSPVSFRE